jgi:hypothetical protein
MGTRIVVWFLVTVYFIYSLRASQVSGSCHICDSLGCFKNLDQNNDISKKSEVSHGDFGCRILRICSVPDKKSSNLCRYEWYISITNKSERQPFNLGGDELFCRFNFLYSEEKLVNHGGFTRVTSCDGHLSVKASKNSSASASKQQGADTAFVAELFLDGTIRTRIRATTVCKDDSDANIAKDIIKTNAYKLNHSPLISLPPKKSVLLKISYSSIIADNARTLDSESLDLFNLRAAQLIINYKEGLQLKQLGPISMCRHAFAKKGDMSSYIRQSVQTINEEVMVNAVPIKSIQDVILKVDYQWIFDN